MRSKNGRPRWCEAHLQVKIVKNCQLRCTYVLGGKLHVTVARSAFAGQKQKNVMLSVEDAISMTSPKLATLRLIWFSIKLRNLFAETTPTFNHADFPEIMAAFPPLEPRGWIWVRLCTSVEQSIRRDEIPSVGDSQRSIPARNLETTELLSLGNLRLESLMSCFLVF